jgi:NAD(P)-dependent dehydrogenase (short-subunit alcohol dehydrogenase family)
MERRLFSSAINIGIKERVFMKCLVAGGAGFIGSHLNDALINEGHRVVCIDNLFIGKMENITHLLDNPDFLFHNTDLADLDSLNKIFEDEKGNSLIGLAEIIVSKHRNGKTGDLRLRFKNEFAKFVNIDEDMPVREYTSNISSREEFTPEPISPAYDDFISDNGSDKSIPF